MRHALAAALVALAVLVWHARAQEMGDQVLLDTVIELRPPDSVGFCMQVGAGTLTIATQVTQGPIYTQSAQPTLTFNGFMGDPDVHMTMRATANEATSTVHLAGTTYCWSLGIDLRSLPPGASQMSMAERGAFIQDVHLKMTLTPQ